jgi:hypothetical protein
MRKIAFSAAADPHPAMSMFETFWLAFSRTPFSAVAHEPEWQVK